MSLTQPSPAPSPAPRTNTFLPPSPMTIGNVFSTAWRLLVSKVGLLLGIQIVQTVVMTIGMLVPIFIGAGIGVAMFSDGSSPTAGKIVTMVLIGLVLLFVALAIVFWAYVKFSAMSIAALDLRARGVDSSWAAANAATKGVARRALTAIIIGILAVLAIYLVFGLVVGMGVYATSDNGQPGAGTVVALVLLGLAVWLAAIYVGTRFQYINQVLSVERLGGMDVFRRAWQLTKGRFWGTFGRMFLGMLAPVVVVSILSGIEGGIVGNDPDAYSSGPVVLLNLLMFVASFLVGMWSISYTTTMYIDQVRRLAAQGVAPVAVARPQQGVTTVAPTAPVDTWGQQPVGPLGTGTQQGVVTPPAGQQQVQPQSDAWQTPQQPTQPPVDPQAQQNPWERRDDGQDTNL